MGGVFCRVIKVKRGKFMRYREIYEVPLTRAFSNVDKAGENSVACAKATRSAALGVGLMAAAVKLIGTGTVGAGVVRKHAIIWWMQSGGLGEECTDQRVTKLTNG